MERNYAISVLIPCHSTHYLAEALKSIENQTLDKHEFEVVLVTDRVSPQVVKSILSRTTLNYRVFVSETPGIVSALNIGLSHIKSDYVARMDEDDRMLTSRLEKQLNFLNEHPEIVAVGGQLRLIDEKGTPLGYSSYDKEVGLDFVSLFTSSPIAHPAAMFRLQPVLSLQGYRDFLPEDWDLWIRLREIGYIRNLSETILEYRIHPNQLSRSAPYAQVLGRRMVAVSHFARKVNKSDHPDFNQNRLDWLEENEKYLRVTSSEFVRYEKHFQKIDKIENLLRYDSFLTCAVEILMFAASNPVTFFSYAWRIFKRTAKNILRASYKYV
jgi:glycosyltransferase involved in cell wall biosynthesis